MPVSNRVSSSKANAARVSSSVASLPYMSDTALTSTLTPSQYLQRVTDLQQMDLQSAVDQMRTLLTLYPQKVYKMAYYRKQTKNHWARDDPAFCFLQVIMVIASSTAYGFAFRVSSLSSIIGFVTKSVLLHWLGFGVVMASVGRVVANQHLQAERSSSHVKQSVEWLYAFDVHCNAFVPLFVLLCKWRRILVVRTLLTTDVSSNLLHVDGIQFFLLPLVLGTSLLSLGISNTLYAIAFGWYFYIFHLGFRALPFLSNTEVFLFPMAIILVLYVFNFVGYPFGLGFNASRIVAYVYFED
ncbi:hypothetical protein THAOC_15303 [Thalassiosira oceanica]|uniref:UNC-50 family protein n=1 Tax=Thalassiosira oceanica TaxID=159749 RepID=K0SG89_THAOC|nr:hypothetical protein THAOC_15303 [Thalassiosira oceanica]|eukprot:EJK64009.1 hypothetical protein THAOC_15303 [Thalassiosira oceanica]